VSNYQGEYEPGRLRRASTRAVKKLGPRQYRVRGNHEPFWDVNLDLDTPCTCPDAEFHGRGCLHELAARLHDGDMALVQALGDMLLKAEEANKTLAARIVAQEPSVIPSLMELAYALEQRKAS
jgi:hypothetical protein